MSDSANPLGIANYRLDYMTRVINFTSIFCLSISLSIFFDINDLVIKIDDRSKNYKFEIRKCVQILSNIIMWIYKYKYTQESMFSITFSLIKHFLKKYIVNTYANSRARFFRAKQFKWKLCFRISFTKVKH